MARKVVFFAAVSQDVPFSHPGSGAKIAPPQPTTHEKSHRIDEIFICGAVSEMFRNPQKPRVLRDPQRFRDRPANKNSVNPVTFFVGCGLWERYFSALCSRAHFLLLNSTHCGYSCELKDQSLKRSRGPTSRLGSVASISIRLKVALPFALPFALRLFQNATDFSAVGCCVTRLPQDHGSNFSLCRFLHAGDGSLVITRTTPDHPDHVQETQEF